MAGNNAVDLRGRDVKAGGQNHVFLAIDDKNATIFVHRCDIAGMQPAIGFNSFPGSLLVAVIAQHHDAALDHQLTHLTYGKVLSASSASAILASV